MTQRRHRIRDPIADGAAGGAIGHATPPHPAILPRPPRARRRTPPTSDEVQLVLELSGLTPGEHAFHIHDKGDCSAPDASSAGGHWNPTASGHGSHTGDLPSILIRANGKAHQEFDTDRFNVRALLDADGSAVVLHAGRDNFANIPAAYSSGEPPVTGPNAATLGTGDAGGRFACGVVRVAS